jgi:hypothetical protein
MTSDKVIVGAEYRTKRGKASEMVRVRILEVLIGASAKVSFRAMRLDNEHEIYIKDAASLQALHGGARPGTGPKPKLVLPCGWCGTMISRDGHGPDGFSAHVKSCPKKPPRIKSVGKDGNI